MFIYIHMRAEKLNHYLITDKHNPNKGHHIIISEDGTQVFYNQAIENVRMHYRDKTEVPGHPGWYDFYEDELVSTNGGHGYQTYIRQAYNQWLKNDKPLEVGDTFNHYFNQADREVEILAVVNGEALGFYEMPRGRKFLCIFDRVAKDKYDSRYHQWKRTQAVKTLPKKWVAALDKFDLEFIQTEVG